jgi:ribosomal protein S18 acetylase RimI-like enzyme
LKEYIFRKANYDDINLLTEIRIKVLKKANALKDDVNMDNVFRETHKYYMEYLNDNNHITYPAFDDKIFIGCGSICFYNVMPTYNNQTGKKAYIMNMYTKENYRRKGIGTKVPDLLVKEAKQKCIKQIQLESTEIGKYLYKKYGFFELNNEMELGSCM